MRRTRLAALTAVLTAPLALAGCGGEPPTIAPSGVDELVIPTPSPDPADFTTTIDNRWLPLEPGTVRTYEVTGDGAGKQTETVTVTDDTRVVAGVTTVVVHDVLTDARGKVVEDTYDWFAQDDDGNVWYFGEDTTEYGDGKPSTEGSWEAGVDGAEAGLVMAARPRIGDGYAQEHLAGVAEDRAEVLSLTERRAVPAGVFGDLVETEDTTPLEPGLVERKFYAEGLGVVLEETVTGGDELVQLVSVTTR